LESTLLEAEQYKKVFELCQQSKWNHKAENSQAYLLLFIKLSVFPPLIDPRIASRTPDLGAHAGRQEVQRSFISTKLIN